MQIQIKKLHEKINSTLSNKYQTNQEFKEYLTLFEIEEIMNSVSLS
jgi:hypothetical protein